jgi:starch synthase
MNILVVAAELSPYAGDTPAAESIASLVKALRQVGHAVTVALPRYPGFEAQGLLAACRLTPLLLANGSQVSVCDGQLASGAHLVLFDVPELFARAGVYGDASGDYPDNVHRFGLLSQAAAALVREFARRGHKPHVVHLHDWPAALAAAALAQDPDLEVATVLTIHDARRQGETDPQQLDDQGLALEPSIRELLLDGSRAIVLRAGVYCADALTTVSTRYAEQLRTEAYGGAVAAAIASCDKPVVGIENGIDYAVYNPATDPALVSHFTAADVSNKGRSKAALIRELGLDLDPERPLVIAIGSPTRNGGFDVLADAAAAVLKGDVTLVVAGNGDAAIAERLAALRPVHPETFAYLQRPHEATVRRLYAAADLAIAPARHEPCDPVPLLAQRYGAVPIARASGGTVDTVVDCDAALETGTGFLYDRDSGQALLGAVQRAVAAVRLPAWPRLRRRVMTKDLSWDRPARRYLAVYQQAIRARA